MKSTRVGQWPGAGMPRDTGTHTAVVPRSFGTVVFFAALHLAVGIGIFFLIRETMPRMRTDIRVVLSLFMGILGAGFVRTWTSETPEETFMSAILAALLAFVTYISIYLFQDAHRIPHYLKMGVYAAIALLAGGLSIYSIYHMLFGGPRRPRR